MSPTPRSRISLALPLIGAVAALSSSPASAVFFDGRGYYSLRGETRTHPGFQPDTGLYQALEQDFQFTAELRANDKLSFFSKFRLFNRQDESYLGDKAQPERCSPRTTNTDSGRQTLEYSESGDTSNCQDYPQSTGEPGYAPFVPQVTEAYARYAFDYCLLEAGRRSREWGMGVFLNRGDSPFGRSASIFDGVTCQINIQKSQTLGLAVGYDKLQETGPSVEGFGGGGSGPSDADDDLHQFFLTIEYDDRKANAGSGFTQQVGFYFANVLGGDRYKTDVKFADLYLSFFLQDLVIKQEVLFRLGKSADPSWARLGGIYSTDFEEPDVNSLDAIAAAGELEYTLARSGTVVGPAEFRQGNASRHALFLEYAYAPGDADGYDPVVSKDPAAEVRKDKKVKAVAFNPNYQPALLLFNERSDMGNMRQDGVFNPQRVMNATVLGLGYRYYSLVNGDVEVKVVGAQLNSSMSQATRNYFAAQSSDRVPVGYDGKSLGYELDVTYNRAIDANVDLGAAAALGLPGDALKVSKTKDPEMTYLLQSHVTFRF